MGFRVTHFNGSLGIGNPTIGGWIIVALYLLASISCWKLARRISLVHTSASTEHHAWRAIAALFFALGINKLLDFQAALTEVGRILVFNEGWYAQRQVVQLTFIFLVGISCVVAGIIWLIWARNAPLSTSFGFVGATFILAFVLIRAASFHPVDHFIGERILGLSWNWILEASGINFVLMASQWRRKRKNVAAIAV
jgi:hypothetical protein